MRPWSAVSLCLLMVVGDASKRAQAPDFHVRDPEIFLADRMTTFLFERSFDVDSRIAAASSELRSIPGREIDWSLLPEALQLRQTLVRRATEIDVDYLVRLAKRESGLNPLARSPRSSAAGLYQFTSGTWFCALLDYGRHVQLVSAGRIKRLPSGRCVPASQKDAHELLALRYDPDISSAIAAPFSEHNAAVYRETFGTHPTDNDLYALHFFGEDVGLRFLRTVRMDPSLPAAIVAPDAARANPTIFYGRKGRPKSVSEVYTSFEL